jgi:DNA-binding LytR/AlgR family response regulator
MVMEDEVLIAEHIKDTLQELGFKEVLLAHDKQTALDILKQHKDLRLAILDVRLQRETDGIDVARVIHKEFDIPFIFLTAQSDPTTLESALNLKPNSYLTKPFKKADVQAAVLLALQKTEDLFIHFKDGWETVKLSLKEVHYVQSDGNYIHIMCGAKKYTIRYSLSWFLEQVPEEMFQRSHRSVVVNLKRIQSLNSSEVVLEETTLPVSRVNYKNLLQRWEAL